MATSLARRAGAAALALFVHNSDEILGDLPGWAAARPELGWMARAQAGHWFVPTAIGLVVLAAGLALWAFMAPARWMETALRLFAWVMLFNAATHLALGLMTASVMPGLISAMLVLVHVFGWIAFAPNKA